MPGPYGMRGPAFVGVGVPSPRRMCCYGIRRGGARPARNPESALELIVARPKGQMLTQENTHVSQEVGPMSQTTRFQLVQDVGMSETTGTSDVPHGHDRAARRLFGHPEVVADLLRGFAPRGPIREFEPESLSPRPDDRVDERLERHQSDLTWVFTLGDGSRAVLIIEAQSTVDRIMAVRMAVQTDLFFEGLLRSAPTEPIPGVLPVVFYTGRDPWRAARSLREIALTKSVDLLTYFAPLCYLLIDARRMPLETLPKRNLVSLMVRMTSAGEPEDLVEVLRSEQAWLAEEDAGLWRDYITWAMKVLAPLEFPDMGEGWSGAARREACFAKPERDDRTSSLGHQRSRGSAAGCHQMPASEEITLPAGGNRHDQRRRGEKTRGIETGGFGRGTHFGSG